jgi:hypothetical protein
MSDADDTLPPDAVDDTQPGQTLSDERKGGVGRPSRRVTFEVNATPLGATARDFVFAKSDEWSVNYASKVLPSGPPGTWQFIERCGIFTSCPKCHTSSFLLPSVSRVMPDGAIHAIQRDGKTVHRFNCGSKKCDWEARAYLDKAWGKTLYCIAAFNNASKKKDKREFHYAVGNSQQEAMTQVILTPGCILIAVGPAVGFKVTDKHGEKLIAEG